MFHIYFCTKVVMSYVHASAMRKIAVLNYPHTSPERGHNAPCEAIAMLLARK